MTGMWNFKLTHLIALLGGCSSSALWADTLTLTGDSRLTGTLHALSTSGTLELRSPLAREPIPVRLDQVTKLTFTPPSPLPNSSSTRLDLINGDQIRVDVDSLDAETLTASTPFAGRLQFPRSAVKSMQVGLHDAETLYSGPQHANEWNQGIDPSKNWNFADKTLSADGAASSSKDFDLPERFVIKASLKWESSANFVISFADPLLRTSDPVDRYLFLFNGAGLEIKRESSKPPRFQTILTRSRTPDQFPTNALDVEIRVDRRTSRLYLYLDGEPEVTGIDPVPQAPTSNGITLINRAAPGSRQEIKDIQILSFDNTAARHLDEKSAAPTQDSLITRAEDRFSGELLSILPTGVFSFKSPIKDSPLTLSEEDISTVFFAEPEIFESAQSPAPYRIHLWDDSRLSGTSCSFSADQVQLDHPLLGRITLNRSAISEFERLTDEAPIPTEE
jgi:hypothetical protein